MTEQANRGDSELDPRIRIRAALRCDGIGRLDCAEDMISGERLAVRWLPLDANGHAAVKACEKLPRHPTLPRILQTGHVGTSAFVALDFPDGEMLSARGEERLENDVLLQIAAQLSDALATVHAQGVVHGEMSRDSVLVVAGGKASLWDMPLVIANRLSDRRGENRLMQNLVKTAPYLAPERARGEGASMPADVYALGAILCVAGGAPLPTAPTTLGVVSQIARGEWSPRVPSTLPDRWRTTLERMVSHDPAARPTATEVAISFSVVPGQNALPTVPELPAVRLPPEIIAAADALMRQQVAAMRAPTREMPAAEVAQLSGESVPTPLGTPAVEAKPAEVEAVEEVVDATPEVVRIPTQELKALEAELAPPPLPAVTVPEPKRIELAPAPSVAMTDSVSVAADLAGDAVQMEARAPGIDKKVWLVLGACAAAVLVLGAVAVNMAMQPQQVVVEAPVAADVAPIPVVQAEPLDELSPLATFARKTQIKRAATKSADAVVASPVEAKPAVVPAVAAEPVKSNDFSFLESSEPQKNELKRPSVDE